MFVLCSLCMGVCVHVEAKVNIRYLALSVLDLPSRNLQVCQVKLHGQLQVALVLPARLQRQAVQRQPWMGLQLVLLLLVSSQS